MPKPFLHLEMHASGLNAAIIEDAFSGQVVKDRCQVLYRDLPGLTEKTDPFEPALSAIASRICLDSCTTAVVLISCLGVSFRILEFPFKSENKIRQILPLELFAQLPMADGSYISDFYVMKNAGQNGHYPVLTASIPEPDFDIIFTGLSGHGIRPVIITPRGYASAIGFMGRNPKVHSFMFLDVGYHAVCMCLVGDRSFLLVRSFALLSFDAAAIGSELKRTAAGFFQRTGNKSRFGVYVASVHADADHAPIDRALAGIEKDRFDPLIICQSSCGPPCLSPRREPGLLLNFCKDRTRQDGFLHHHARNITVTLLIGVAVLGLFFGSVFHEIHTLETRIAMVESEMEQIFSETFPDKKNIGEPLLQMQSLVRQVRQKSGLSSGNDPAAGKPACSTRDILHELSVKIPPSIDMEISRLLLNQDRLTLSGSTDHFNSVDQVKGLLETSGIFKKVTISNAAADKNGSRILFGFMIGM